MPIAVNPNKEWSYILECDRQSERPTVFKLRALKVRDGVKLNNILAECVDLGKITGKELSESEMVSALKPGAITAMQNANIERVRLGVVGWEDFLDESGAPVPFKRDADGRLSEESLEWLSSIGAIAELAQAIVNRNVVTVADLGKSQSCS
jgi:hypothetical protein